MPLRAKQQSFCDYYTDSTNKATFNNATESAKEAGYKGNQNTLGSIAFENLTKPAIIEAIAKIYADNQAKNEHDLQISIDNLYADYKRLETAANAGNIAAINARTSIMRELDCINGLQKQTITNKTDPITAIDPELQARLDIVARDYKERKARTG